ncbi:hypothetical protein PTE30175_01350 [Pandoraea terrae]|uniref:Uncharacterized protein n=1 Tax=Pandoraea terrae TaxID=1537710 RepID=A0A5E4TFF8_9BURK|nr:hypothetical protein PTE30175_01350 [Pandoraea terrae]
MCQLLFPLPESQIDDDDCLEVTSGERSIAVVFRRATAGAEVAVGRLRSAQTVHLLRISANVTADFGNVTDSAGLALRGIDCRVSIQFWSSSVSRMLGLGDAFLSDSPVSVIR